MSWPPVSEELTMFRKTVRDFVEKEMAPHALEWDEAGIFPKEIFKRFGEMGFFGISYPEEFGGSGLDYWFSVAFLEELTRSKNAGVNMAMTVQSDIALPPILEFGSDEQKKEFLMPAIAGDRIAALGVTEPDAGSDVANIRTTARKVGGDYVINGAKTYITNGCRADFIVLAVRSGEEGYGGISLVLFPTDTPGFQVSQSLKKLGNLSSDTGLLFFEECKIPERYVLGEENHGFYYIMTGFQRERLAASLLAVAGMDRMMEDAVRYTQERQAFGRPVSKFQVWRHRFAEMMTNIEAARQLTYMAVDKFVAGENPIKEITMAKLFTSELSQKVAYDCLQAHGGAGYMTEYDIARSYRDARLLTIGAGSSEVMKEILGKMEGF